VSWRAGPDCAELEGIGKAIGVTVVIHSRRARLGFPRWPGFSRDPVNGFLFREAYAATDPNFDSRVTVPSFGTSKPGGSSQFRGRHLPMFNDCSTPSATPSGLLPQKLEPNSRSLSALFTIRSITGVTRRLREQAASDKRHAAPIFAALNELEPRWRPTVPLWPPHVETIGDSSAL